MDILYAASKQQKIQDIHMVYYVYLQCQTTSPYKVFHIQYLIHVQYF